MTSVVHGTRHESSVDAEILSTSYKWNLKHWSILYKRYHKGVFSRKFSITDYEGCTCTLLFKTILPNQQSFTEISKTILEMNIEGKIEFDTIQIAVSLVDECMNKLTTITSVYESSIPSPACLQFKKSLTETEVDKYLQDDTLILFFEMKIIKDIVMSPLNTDSFIPNFSTNICDEIKDLYESKVLCDVILLIEDTKTSFVAHKFILAANSPVFRATFTNFMKEKAQGTVEIKDIDDAVFEVFLRYLYTGKVDNIEKFVNELIAVADKYQVVTLIELCEKYMTTHINHANVIKYLLTAHEHSRTLLEKKAIEFIKRNTSVLANEAEQNLFCRYPTLIKQIFSV